MKSILFVDDEPIVLRSLEFAFRRDRARWNIAFASGGDAALRALDDAHFDLVITDLQMPGMNGAEMLERVKIAHPNTVRVVLSGDAELKTLERARSLSVEVLNKPCSPKDIKACIERHLGA